MPQLAVLRQPSAPQLALAQPHRELPAAPHAGALGHQGLRAGGRASGRPGTVVGACSALQWKNEVEIRKSQQQYPSQLAHGGGHVNWPHHPGPNSQPTPHLCTTLTMVGVMMVSSTPYTLIAYNTETRNNNEPGAPWWGS